MTGAAHPFLRNGRGAEILLDVFLAPRSGSCRIMGVHDGRLKVAVTAPPVDGAANEGLVAFLAKILGCAKRQIGIASGHKSKRKTLSVTGLSVPEIEARLDEYLGSAYSKG